MLWPCAVHPPLPLDKSSGQQSMQVLLFMLWPPWVLMLQIKRCKTDSFTTLEWDNPERPEATNLLTMYQLSTGKTKVCRPIPITADDTTYMCAMVRSDQRRHIQMVQHRTSGAVVQPLVAQCW